MFLADLPNPRWVEALDPDRSPGTRFMCRVGRFIFTATSEEAPGFSRGDSYLPQGVARTKLTNAFFDTGLGTTSTGRNWRTVTKLLALIEERR